MSIIFLITFILVLFFCYQEKCGNRGLNGHQSVIQNVGKEKENITRFQGKLESESVLMEEARLIQRNAMS